MADLILKQKVLDMLPYMEQRLANFPKEQRYGITVRIRSAGYDMLELASDIGHGYYNVTTLKTFDRRKNAMRAFVDYALSNRIITPHQHKVWGGMFAEIGRIVGGLHKTLASRKGTG